jgi:hypothetical protein
MMHFFGLMFAMYWLPTIVALVRHSPSAPGIAVLNFFLGWTGIGWIVAMVWALASAPRQQINVYIDGNRATISK